MKTYSELIDEFDKNKYSLNFLLAEFEETTNLLKKTDSFTNQMECEYFETKNFKDRPYYKHISRCVKNFEQ